MAKPKKAQGGGGAPAWMATFADMMSLLLTFFILLLSFAEMDIVKFKDAMGSINRALGFMPTGTGMFSTSSAPSIINDPVKPSPEKKDSDSSESSNDELVKRAIIQEKLNEIVKSTKGLEDTEVENTRKGVVMRVKGKMFFTPGTAKLKQESYEVLQKVAQLMREFNSRVSIEGHTDNIPLRGGRYANNWELSTARAYSALKFLQDHEGIDAQNINIAGFGDTHPITTNDTPEGRARNRRVEFVFMEE